MVNEYKKLIRWYAKMSKFQVDYVKDAALHKLKNSNAFSTEYKLDTNQGASLVSVFINLTNKVNGQEYQWLVSIPQFNTSFFLPAHSFSNEMIEEALNKAGNPAKSWNKELAQNIYRQINAIINGA